MVSAGWRHGIDHAFILGFRDATSCTDLQFIAHIVQMTLQETAVGRVDMIMINFVFICSLSIVRVHANIMLVSTYFLDR